jgi:hypothetical protein
MLYFRCVSYLLRVKETSLSLEREGENRRGERREEREGRRKGREDILLLKQSPLE